MKVAFYDNEYKNPTNRKFVLEIKTKIEGAEVIFCWQVDFFEKIMRKEQVDVIILDLMGTETGLSGINTKQIIPRKDIGIELLDRIRARKYPLQHEEVPIILRTARAKEPGISPRGLGKGANYCLSPGADDLRIIEIISGLNR